MSTVNAVTVTSTLAQALSVLDQGKTIREMRKLIFALEEKMKLLPECVGPEAFKTTHHFDQGVYMRELFIPADSLVTGRIHRFGHMNLLTQGTITVWTEQGMKTLTAPAIIQSFPGIKRVGYTHSDTTWVTVHSNPDNERDISKVEKKLFADTFDEAYLGSARTFDDVAHFLGFTLEEIQATSENLSDMDKTSATVAFLHNGNLNFEIGPSKIHGNGVFAKTPIKRDQVIGPSRIKGKRTLLGRYCNHSAEPNIKAVMRENGDVDMVALKDIEAGQELTNDYYLTYIHTRSKEGDLLCPR